MHNRDTRKILLVGDVSKAFLDANGAAGEQAGNLEVVLRQMASHIEKGVTVEKQIKNALTYPFVVVFVAVIVVIILVKFVLA